jgi:TonB-dependent starch-binding outer membrane protein SusC
MRTIRQRLARTSTLGLSLGLAACAGQPINAGLRSSPVNRFASSSSSTMRSRDTTAVTRTIAPEPESRHYATVEELLTGQVAGLSVFRRSDGTVSLRVRGLGPTVEDAEPLLVVNGMAMSATSNSDMINSLGAIQVARIEVLKDIAATSIYGSRGVHGVVLITTRR